MPSLVPKSALAILFAPLLSAQALFERDMGTNLHLGDDATAQGLSLGFSFPFAGSTYGHICVCSNGYIWLGPTSVTGGDFTPSDADLRAGAPRMCPLWTDFNPTAEGSGQIWFKSLPDRAVVSWAGVYEYGTQNAVEMQVTLYPSGHVDVAYGANPAAGGLFNSTILIGASPGGGAAPNPVTFAIRPMLTGSDTFSETFAAPGAIPYHTMKWDCSPAFPGFAVSDMPFVQNSLPPPAKFEEVGAACPDRTITLYERYGNGVGTALDIGGSELTFVPNMVGGFVVSRTVPRPPSPGFANDLIAGDETRHLVTLPFAFPHQGQSYNQIVVAANGFVTLGPDDPGSGCCSGDVAALLAGPPRIAGFWLDLNPSAGGSVFTTYDPIKGDFAVVWDRVPEYPNVGANTFRIVLHPSGIFRVSDTAVALANGTSLALVGYSEGGDAQDPGATDLTAIAAPLDLGAHLDPLKLLPLGSSLPVIGTTFMAEVQGIKGMLAYLSVGLETAPVPLDPIGATGCESVLQIPPLLTLVQVVWGAPAADFPLPVPLSLDLAGQQVMLQAISDDPLANALGGGPGGPPHAPMAWGGRFRGPDARQRGSLRPSQAPPAGTIRPILAYGAMTSMPELPPAAASLQQKIQDRTASVGIVGLGYVGLPLMRAFFDAGFPVIGFDVDARKVEMLRQGQSYLKHLGEDFVAAMAQSDRFVATSEPGDLARADAVILCVPTPLGSHGEPDMTYIEKSTEMVASVLQQGQLVSLESTTYPGTTRGDCLPILARSGLVCGQDYFLAFSPEREDPGRKDHGTQTIPKLVGGVDAVSTELARQLYAAAIREVVPVDSAETAEAAKLLENIYRCVNIALVNELKPVLAAMGIDIWKVIAAAATKPFGFQAFYPGPGLGGHCIPIDPFYLTWKAKEYGHHTRFIELAGQINSAMPHYVIHRAAYGLNEQGKAMRGAKVLVVGLAYKPDVDDVRETPAAEIIKLLFEQGADVTYHDPHVPLFAGMRKYMEYRMQSQPLSPTMLKDADCVLIVTNHKAVDYRMIADHARLVVDSRNAMAPFAPIQGLLVQA